MNELSKKKLAMRRKMRKPRDMSFKRSAERLMEIDNFLPLFPGSDPTKKTPPEELNDKFLHAAPNGWERQSYLQGWDFEMNT